jgi:hypothetical protein
MIDNQSGQRNLTDGWKFELAQTKKAILAEKGREKQKETLGGFKHQLSVLSKTDKTENHKTRNEIAEELNWSTGKVAQADVIWKKAESDPKAIRERQEGQLNGKITARYLICGLLVILRKRLQGRLESSSQNRKSERIIRKVPGN